MQQSNRQDSRPAPSEGARECAIWVLTNCAGKYVSPEGYAATPQQVIDRQIQMATKRIDAYAHSLSQSTATMTREPDGYAYRYGDGFIRFTNGEPVNGGKPTESIPYWWRQPNVEPPSAPSVEGLFPLLREMRKWMSWKTMDTVLLKQFDEALAAIEKQRRGE